MLPLVTAAAGFATYALIRLAPQPPWPTVRATALGIVLGFAAAAIVALDLGGLLARGTEEASAILLLFVVGAWSTRWGVTPTDLSARLHAGRVASLCMMGMAGAWAGTAGGIAAGLVASVAAGAAGWAFEARRSRPAWAILGIAIFVWPLLADRMAPERALAGFAALAAGALVGWLAVSRERVMPREWGFVVAGFVFAITPTLLAGA